MSPMTTDHPSAPDLAAFALGKLDGPSAELVQAHLGTCVACRTIAEQTPADSLVDLLKRAGSPGRTTTQFPTPSGHEPEVPTLPPSAADLPVALRDHPRYRILRLLGRGGMGVVYQAEHKVMERLVAVKVISQALVERPDALERFRREVRAAAKLDHPNIVKAYDAEQAGDLQLLAMEFVDGRSLAEVLDKKGPLPIANACHYIRQAALGLQHAFEQGMVHRDLKPQNLMLTPKGVVKVLDFGLAKIASESVRPGGGLTQENMVMGTPEYMAPEQAINSKAADIRADIYALGATLYCLLTGRPPFTGDPLAVILAHSTDAPSPVESLRPGVPAALAALVGRMLAKDPAQRPQTPKEVADALAPFTKPAAITPTIPQKLDAVGGSDPFAGLAAQPARPAKPSTVRRGWLFPAMAAGLLLAVGGLVAGIVMWLKVPGGMVKLEVEPPDAKVEVVDGKITVSRPGDAEPWRIEMAGEKGQLKISKAGFVIQTREVTLGEKGQTIRVVLNPEPSTPPVIAPRTTTNTAANPVLVMETSMGAIKIELFEDKAPITGRNYLSYVDDKFYDNTIFHRVIKDFMNQAGGFDADKNEKKTKGNIKNEWQNGLSNVRGTLAMARRERDPDTASAQFFINVGDNKALDTARPANGNAGYCVFGKVIDGMDVVDKINNVRIDRGPPPFENAPAEKVVIKSVKRVAKTLTADTHVYELRTYTAAPGKLDALIARFRDHTRKLFQKHGITSVGYWLPVDNPESKFYYLLSHASREAADESWKAFLADPEWREARDASEVNGALVTKIDNQFLTRTDYSPTVSPGLAGDERVYELRTYTVAPGMLADLHARFRDHTLKLFEKHGMTNVGYWTPMKGQPGADTTLVYMLAHKSVAAAKASFGAFARDPDWVAARESSEKKAGGPLTVPGGVKSVYLKPIEVLFRKIEAKAPAAKTLTADPGGGVTMEFVRIPAGSFTMGSPKEEVQRNADEDQHPVRISKDFYLGKYPVTQEQYSAFIAGHLNNNSASGENKDSVASMDTSQFPVDSVSWQDAVNFCGKLSARDPMKRVFRLPTEAEWEYACRGGHPSNQPFGIGDGQSLSSTQANFNGVYPYGSAAKGPFLARTTRVGTYEAKAPHAWGLCDMHGNVSQWCQDWYDAGYYARSPGVDPICTDRGQSFHVMRGGRWNQTATNCRAANRMGLNVRAVAHFYGFRVAFAAE